jgi:hypothetical protein
MSPVAQLMPVAKMTKLYEDKESLRGVTIDILQEKENIIFEKWEVRRCYFGPNYVRTFAENCTIAYRLRLKQKFISVKSSG